MVDQSGRRGGEELGEVEGEETVIRIYRMRKQSAFNKRGRNGQFLLSTLSGLPFMGVGPEQSPKNPHLKPHTSELMFCDPALKLNKKQI